MAAIQESALPVREIIFNNFNFSLLTHSFILANSAAMPDSGASNFFMLQPASITINLCNFTNQSQDKAIPAVIVQYHRFTLLLSCNCSYTGNKLCHHQTQVLYNIMERADLRVYFDEELRHAKIREFAKSYGLQNVKDPDEYFKLIRVNGKLTIEPLSLSLLSVNEDSLLQLSKELLVKTERTFLNDGKEGFQKIIVLGTHKYHQHLQINIYEAAIGLAGKIKNPITQIDTKDLAWDTNNAEELKFYAGIEHFLFAGNKPSALIDLKALRAIVVNPLQLPVYFHDSGISENISAVSLVPVKLTQVQTDLKISVFAKESFYEISGQVQINDLKYQLDKLPVKYGYFIFAEHSLFLLPDTDVLRVINFFKKHHNTILIHQSVFEEFRKTILVRLEDKISINYSWLAAATKEQLKDNGFAEEVSRIIYLSDAGQHVMINPVMRYGEVEVSITSKRQLYARDQKGVQFIVERDDVAELEFTALLLKQHPDFLEQLHQEAFYLTKKQFLEEDWFPEVFEEWRKNNINVLGFNEIKNNKLNPNKATVSIKVNSGLDWFNTDLEVRYGKQKASLRELHKSVKNGNKYVTLGDGTLGILPAEWIEKMSSYFEAGEVVDESIRTPFIQFLTIRQLYEKELLSIDVQKKLDNYQYQIDNFNTIGETVAPPELKTTLRHYQQQGLNWLNFLDDIGFGGCLADDMGLGKTIQIIAFILLLRSKKGSLTNLIIVPASLIFNWKNELLKFAPSLSVLIVQPNNKLKTNKTFAAHDVVLTSYGMLLSANHLLKSFRFNYIFLDESQAIKNPDSQRYMAACLLQSYNKIVMSGTPIENNTFDLYGQLSFACPGLLGNKQYFKDIYSQPIDKFSNSKRAEALQIKINPFILRRTKKQVATELPEKTEMIIYCEMGIEQRKVYDAYEKEFRNYLLNKEEGDLPRETMHVLQGLTKLRQICNSPALLKDESYFGDAAAKIKVLIEQIEGKSKQHKILVFSQFVSMLDLIAVELKAKYIPFEYLTGKTKDRASAVGSFQENDNIRVFLISLKAGGTGLNLTEADYVYLVDPWWNPAVENQAIDRCYRIGQQKKVVAIRLICPDTIEEKIMLLQASKTQLVNNLVKTDTTVLKHFTKQDLLNLLNFKPA